MLAAVAAPMGAVPKVGTTERVERAAGRLRQTEAPLSTTRTERLQWPLAVPASTRAERNLIGATPNDTGSHLPVTSRRRADERASRHDGIAYVAANLETDHSLRGRSRAGLRC
eukprot:scaffold99475_cov72-Phaeocystis_antarctica.AAC.1